MRRIFLMSVRFGIGAEYPAGESTWRPKTPRDLLPAARCVKFLKITIARLHQQGAARVSNRVRFWKLHDRRDDLLSFMRWNHRARNIRPHFALGVVEPSIFPCARSYHVGFQT